MPDLNLGHTRLIRDAADAAALTPQQTAYVLATAYWETARTVLPVEEAYYLGARAEAYRRSLRYYPWHGRGFAQLTWERNYIRAGQVLGVDLISAPERAMDPEISAQILVIGSRDGWFTGKRLSDFIGPGRCDYVQARRVINGLDAAVAIADIALDYEHQLTPGPAYQAIRRGSRGAVVSEAQRHLAAHGYDPGLVDGIFGGMTEAAARAFQRSAGLVPDGIIGPKTWAALIPEMEI
jgi:hypothetical protein